MRLNGSTNRDAGLVASLTVAGFTRPSGETDALAAIALAITRADLVVDAVAREVVALTVLTTDNLCRVAASLTLTDTAETVSPIAAENIRRIVHFAERFQVRDVCVARALAVLPAITFVANANPALQVAAVVALFRVWHKSLYQEWLYWLECFSEPFQY